MPEEAPAETPAQAEAPVETPAQEAAGEAEEEETEEPEEALQAGTQAGNRYENAFLGIGCELDENWVLADREELAQLVGMTAEMFEDENFRTQMENADMFYDLMAQNLVDGSTINIVIQNLGLLFGSAVSVEQYVAASGQQLEAQLNSAGFTDVSWEINSVELAGEERDGIHVAAKVQGLDYYSQPYIKVGRYIAAVTFGSFGEDNAAQLAENFFALG